MDGFFCAVWLARSSSARCSRIIRLRVELSSWCSSEGRRRRSRQIGGLRVEVLEGYLSKNQTTGEVKIREVTFELLREVGFRLGHNT